MSFNSFGHVFRFSTWGESHGPAIGAMVDGCPPGIKLSEADLQPWLDKRRPGTSRFTTQRREPDEVRILSGVFEGVTTGTPISLLIENVDQRSKDYSNISGAYRPGHADYAYDSKYGLRDWRGGGRSSARETASRVAAGGVARLVIPEVRIRAYVAEIVVSSGAVALGRVHLGLKRSARLDHKQAAAAAGQSQLMQAWEEALAPHGIPTAQLLLTIEDTEQRRRWLNARATIEVLLSQRALPVINENDSVATDELRYGDNDRLSARAAQMIRSDLLILLSDVDGIYTADPTRNPDAEHLPYIEELTPTIEGYASGTSADGVGSGGMRTKIAAARFGT